jgi:hypothetical protein
MSVVDVVQETWRALTPDERRAILTGIQAISPAFNGAGKSAAVLSYIDDADDLPADVFGRLILATTDIGFDLDEYRRTRSILLTPADPTGEPK